MLWFVIAGEKTSESGLSGARGAAELPAGPRAHGRAPSTRVEVRLRASPGIIHAPRARRRLAPRSTSPGVAEGERIVHLTPESIRVPFGVKVVKITPSILTLNLERTLQKVVPVRPRLLGRPAPGYEVAEVDERARPRSASPGPRSRVQEIESAFTEPVSVEAARRP